LQKRQRKDSLWNWFSILVLLGAAGAVFVFYLIYQNPQSVFNPYPPPTMPAALALPTATETPPSLPATWTPEISATPQPNVTLDPVGTEEMTDVVSIGETQSSTLMAATEDPGTAVSSNYPYMIKGTPAPIAAVIIDSSRQECDWMGVGGQVHDLQGRPVTGVVVQLGGKLDGSPISQFSLTGTALNYGPAGYEFKLSDHPIASQGTLWIRLIDQSNYQISSKIYFDTYDMDDCSKNLVIINFKQVR
jgi:hypothetical protein